MGNKIEEHEDFVLCHTGLTPGLHGVGFMINIRHKKNIESYTGLTERVALLNMLLEDTHLSFIQVYAPTENANEEDINKFYETVAKALELAHKDFILMGDLNAKIGIPKKEEYLIMKQNGYGERNERGQRLVDFALENKLSILNTFFKKKPKNKWTWRSPNGKYTNEIDFILSNRTKIFENVEVMNINYPSDHRAVRATITLAASKKSRSKYNTDQIKNLNCDEEIAKFQDAMNKNISEGLPEIDEKTSVQHYYDIIINSITKSLKYARIANKETNKILSDRTLKLIRRKQEIQRIKPKSRAIKNELRALYKLTSKYIKIDYNKHRQNIIEKHINTTGSTKKAYKELRTHKTWIDGIKRNEIVLNNRSDIIKVATDFYKNLYSFQHPQDTNNAIVLPTGKESGRATAPEIEINEVITALKNLKIEKSPGPDNITNDTLRIASKELAKPLTNLFNLVLKTGETPTQWSESNIILIYKKGDSKDIANYRPISLLPCVYKLFSSIINHRICNTLDARQPVEQAGFRKGFSTVDHIHTLELLIEKFQEMRCPLYLAFIDYKKAFDTLSHDSIWETLRTQNVEKEYIQVLKNIYSDCRSRVKLEKVGPWFPVKRGVRQGDPISPKLFIATLESVISHLDWSQYGIKIGTKCLNHLRFADDLVLISQSGKDLQSMIDSLNIGSNRVGLEMNLCKTMLMTNSVRRTLSVGSEPLEYTDHYLYLGKQISFTRESNEREVERRSQLTWNKYWSLREIFKGNLPIHLKTRLMNSCLLPCLTYACQTWKFNNNVRNKIITCQRGMERSMLNIRKIQKIRHTQIRQITNAKDGLAQALTLKWKWAGHVARLQDQRWTKKVTAWKGPLGKRKRGRPCARWEDDLVKVAGVDWLELAKSREDWTALEEAFTCRGVLADEQT
ncbi:unnamed protein product [Colias eurytheme]|nr:unnamed protein product [Colias eurytheme]